MSTKEKLRARAWELVKQGVLFVIFLMVIIAVGSIVLEKELQAAKECPDCVTTVILSCPWYDICDWLPTLAVVGLMTIALILVLAYGPGMGMIETGDVK